MKPAHNHPRHIAEAGRLDAFVDAAFAFAITLLLIAGAEPITTMRGLQAALLQTPASAVAFALVALFWTAHRGYGRLTPHRDGLSTFLSLAIVFSVLVYVFPLRMLVSTGLYYISGGLLPGAAVVRSFDDLRLLYMIYGLGFTALSCLYALLFRHTAKAGDMLGVSAEDRSAAADATLIWAISALAGMASTILALVFPLRLAPYLPGLGYWLIPAGLWIRAVLKAQARRRAQAQPPP